jgi:hypothetical protein
MKILRTAAMCASAILLLGAVITGSSPQSDRSDQGDRTDQADQIDRDVLIAREAAWRAYFDGDVQTLGDLLPPEFIGIGMNEGPFTDRATTLAGATITEGATQWATVSLLLAVATVCSRQN